MSEALTGVLQSLVSVGGAPHHLTSMEWETDDPGAFHPSRRAIDLACREVLLGFCPPPVVTWSDSRGLKVRALATIDPSDTGTIYGRLTLADLSREYSLRSQAKDIASVFARWAEDGARFRNAHAGLDLSYGSKRTESLDLYRPRGVARPPVWIFIHGGYWQAMSKEQNAQFAAGMLAAGFAVANIEYSLAPEVTLEEIVMQVRAAVAFLAGEADRLLIDGDELHLAGHSAGGHLAAMAVANVSDPPIRSALLLSGLFDLEPFAFLPAGAVLGLTDSAMVRRLSPVHLHPQTATSIRLALGEKETREFKRQSSALAKAWGAPAPLIIPDVNHFDLLDGLIDGPLLEVALAVAGARPI